MKIRMITAALTAVFLLAPIGTVTAYAGGGPDGQETPAPVVSPAPAQVPATEYPPKPFTPGGTATVIDNAKDNDGKEFYTIMTPDENVFYLVIDKQRGQENVYFLNAVTEADLLALAKITQTPDPVPAAPTPSPAPDEQEPAPETPTPEKGGGMGNIFLIVAVLAIGGGAGWYFKIYRPKQQHGSAGDDFDYTDADEADAYGDDNDAEDDTPPWDDDEDENGDDDE